MTFSLIKKVKAYIKEQKCKTVNGCGPWWLPNFLRHKTFGAACEFHDLKYSQGGSESDRKKADRDFYSMMKNIVSDKGFSGIIRSFYMVQAKAFYLSVKILGKYRFFGRFNYHGKESDSCQVPSDKLE